MISYSPGALRPMFAPFRIPPVSAPLNHSIASTRPLPRSFQRYLILRDKRGRWLLLLFLPLISRGRFTRFFHFLPKKERFFMDFRYCEFDMALERFLLVLVSSCSIASFQVAFKVSLGRREMDFRTGSKYIRGFAKYQSRIFPKIK